ncbi:MAG: PEP-CTERM sorting domain-containing protein [Fimbriimonadaceae bacterium]|nr:PEP-CTERM sorting domain-containing protein [Chthonomonadaceae bacterium]MCO5296779.1 PEP-CTERM sorting domain-containing protein [Fimbriimonadaceae bacterium]
MKGTLFVGLMTAAALASADGVVPTAFAATEAPSTFSLTSTVTARTYMFVIDSSQLGALVNTDLNGMQWRLNGAVTANWPSVATSYTFFDIWVGAGVDPTATSNVFADNFTGGSTQVRSGPLTFNPGDFTSGGSPNAFGATVGFNSSYTYTGGDLAILMRFSTQSGATNQPSFDGVAATDTANGYGTLFAARWVGDPNATTGGNANFLVTNLVSTPVPEPATLAALGFGAAALLRRRRNR